MELSIQGKQLDIGQSLHDHIEKELSHIIDKYFKTPATKCTVTLSKINHDFQTHIHIHVNKYLTLQSEGEGSPYESFNKALARLESRLKKHKNKLLSHKTSHTMAVQEAVISLNQKQNDPSNNIQDDLQQEDYPLIIAEIQTDIEKIDIYEAVMRLELGNLNSFIFFDHNEQPNFLYKKDDGTIGWFNPSLASKKGHYQH